MFTLKPPSSNLNAVIHPVVEPYDTQRLQVSPLHTLHVDQVGNPDGLPVLFLHGGPGAGCGPKHQTLFDPDKFRVIFHDQRGSGRSTPHACIEDNTTWHLVQDIELIRQHLGIERWLVLGGSWGSTLALAYAQSYPERVTELILRGIFLCRTREISWFYQSGAHWNSPQAWAHFEGHIPAEERDDMLGAYYRRLIHGEPHVQQAAAKQWAHWEGSSCRLLPTNACVSSFIEPKVALALAKIECHYFNHASFFTRENEILNPRRIDRIRHIPTTLVHGRYDLVCPLKNAWDLHQAFPESQLHVIPDAGHAFDEPGLFAAQQAKLNAYTGE